MRNKCPLCGVYRKKDDKQLCLDCTNNFPEALSCCTCKRYFTSKTQHFKEGSKKCIYCCNRKHKRKRKVPQCITSDTKLQDTKLLNLFIGSSYIGSIPLQDYEEEVTAEISKKGKTA
jgi:hypothetical protein